MKQVNVKKLILPNIPYVFIALLATKVSEAVRLAPGSDASTKLLNIMTGLNTAFHSLVPSFHPIDLCVGVAAAIAIRLAVYIKGKNAKKFRKNLEYGSARWGTAEDIKPYVDPAFENNIILTQTERLTMNSRPKDPKTARNKNVLIVGGSGSGKTRFWLKPNLLQCTSKTYATNQKVAEISGQVGLSPQAWNGSIFSMIQNLSETVIVPIAGAILAFVMTLELIQLITDKNNLNDMDTWIFFKWAFKSAAAVLIVTNTWAIVMGVFDAAQSVVASASGLIIGDTSIDISSVMVGIEDRLMEMELGPLFGLWFQSLFVGITMWALTICIFIITFGRMIEIYLVTSVAPIPMATMMGKEWGGMGQNYIRSLLALGFQAFLIIVCVAIYAVLVQNIALVDDIIYAIWTCMGYTVLLCFCLFKTSSLAKSVFNAH